MAGKGYKVGVVYERYGYILIRPEEAKTEEEAIEAARRKLEEMSIGELEAMTSFLENTEKIDEEGVLPL